MNKKITRKTNKLFFTFLIAFTFLNSVAQYQIQYQGFDSTASDTWNYSNSINTGTIETNTSTFVSSPNSLRFGGSNTSTAGITYNDPEILFNNVSISAYTNVNLKIHFSDECN